MTENNPEVTQAVPQKKKKKDKKKFLQKRSSWYLIGLLAALVIILAGALLGIPRGINDRVKLAEAQAAPKIESQLALAQADIAEGRYQVAKTRLDWILDNMSPYLTEAELATVGDLYSQTLLMMESASTSTPAPTPTSSVPTATPTPDTRGDEDLFTTAQGYIAAESWEEAIQTLEALREKNLEYRAVEVDGMFYLALRNRGVNKITIDGSLEPGIYDLTLAEQFAPLDSYADGVRTYARYYLTGASYWEVDWLQVYTFFDQVRLALPNLRDGTGMTATQRFQRAANEYGTLLANEKKWCQAHEYFSQATAIGVDPDFQELAQKVADECWADQNPPTEAPPEATPTPTVEPTSETPPPTEEPTTEP
jgi:tetratricopeptide (TPR) repeat protein